MGYFDPQSFQPAGSRCAGFRFGFRSGGPGAQAHQDQPAHGTGSTCHHHRFFHSPVPFMAFAIFTHFGFPLAIHTRTCTYLYVLFVATHGACRLRSHPGFLPCRGCHIFIHDGSEISRLMFKGRWKCLNTLQAYIQEATCAMVSLDFPQPLWKWWVP